MDLTLNAVYLKVPEGYIGFVEELPGANTQGTTLREARENLQEAAGSLIASNKAFIKELIKGGQALCESLSISREGEE
ncbi:MAG: type II toxin-antitoxin system HicB family antitoxin [Pyrinomonadaceae bacterium]